MSKIELYRHPQMTDVAFEIMWKDVVDDRRQMIGVAWWNIVPSHPPYPMGYRQAITVNNEWLHQLISYSAGRYTRE